MSIFAHTNFKIFFEAVIKMSKIAGTVVNAKGIPVGADLQNTLSLSAEIIKPVLWVKPGFLEKFKHFLTVFLIGALGYVLLELLWRGRSHWTMAVTGGICFLLVYAINNRYSHKKLWQKCLFGAFAISTVEFLVGITVNLWLGWRVWNYSKLTFNLLGQVSLEYSVLWFLLCIPLSYFSLFLYKRLNKS